jgi:hypothetical protein
LVSRAAFGLLTQVRTHLPVAVEVNTENPLHLVVYVYQPLEARVVHKELDRHERDRVGY